MRLNVTNETNKLKTVVLGQPRSMGQRPFLSDVFDAKSYESVCRGDYPGEQDVVEQMNAFEQVLRRYDVEVLRPKVIEDYNQTFARDVAFVIDDKLIISNIIPDRANELEAYRSLFNQVEFNKIFNLPPRVHVEGGDVVLRDNEIFVGLYSGSDYSSFKTARTNLYAVSFLRELFPEKTVIPLELKKHDTDPLRGVLHLDCTFMPIGEDKAILCKYGFAKEENVHFLYEYFGKENIFEINAAEMSCLTTNVFSISSEVVVSEQGFERLNSYMEAAWGLTVERVPYAEICKMGGLLRCSTLPLIRE